MQIFFIRTIKEVQRASSVFRHLPTYSFPVSARFTPVFLFSVFFVSDAVFVRFPFESSGDEHIIRLRFFEGKTQIEVADEIHISQAQVSRLEKNALKSMQGYLRT